mgnify:CR=1 FL=1
MREATYSYGKNLFSMEQIKEINLQINKSFISGSDLPALTAKKNFKCKISDAWICTKTNNTIFTILPRG